MKRKVWTAIVLGMCVTGLEVRAQEVVSTTAPSSMPAGAASTTQPTSRPRLVVPQGFVRLDIGERHFLIEPSDEAWVRQAVAKAQPATRPSTMPSDLLGTIKDRREELLAAMVTDLGVSREVVEKWLDEKLVPAITELGELKVAVVTMVSHRTRVRDLMASGWEAPVFRYNRAMNEVYQVPVAVMGSDTEAADALVPAIYDPAQSVEERIAKLASELAVVEGDVLEAKSQRAQYYVQMGLVELIGNDVLRKLELKPDQEWFLMGGTGVLTAKYLAQMTGVPRRLIVRAMGAENPRGVRTTTIDLLHPIGRENLRKDAVLPYMDAFRRKSVRVMDDVLLRAGDEAIAKMLTAVREKKPATGDDLVKLVLQVTGVDVGPKLKAGSTGN